jgi:hypothetical protein
VDRALFVKTGFVLFSFAVIYLSDNHTDHVQTVPLHSSIRPQPIVPNQIPLISGDPPQHTLVSPWATPEQGREES